jgi:hypothetical protein
MLMAVIVPVVMAMIVIVVMGVIVIVLQTGVMVMAFLVTVFFLFEIMNVMMIAVVGMLMVGRSATHRKPQGNSSEAYQPENGETAPENIAMKVGGQHRRIGGGKKLLIIGQDRDDSEQAAHSDGAQLLHVISGLIVRVLVSMAHKFSFLSLSRGWNNTPTRSVSKASLTLRVSVPVDTMRTMNSHHFKNPTQT